MDMPRYGFVLLAALLGLQAWVPRIAALNPQ